MPLRQSFNYVIFSDADVTIEQILQSRQAKDAPREADRQGRRRGRDRAHRRLLEEQARAQCRGPRDRRRPAPGGEGSSRTHARHRQHRWPLPRRRRHRLPDRRPDQECRAGAPRPRARGDRPLLHDADAGPELPGCAEGRRPPGEAQGAGGEAPRRRGPPRLWRPGLRWRGRVRGHREDGRETASATRS